MPLLTNGDWREKLEPEHRPSDRRACLFAGRFRLHAGMIGYIHMNPVRRKLANEPVEWRWSSCPLLFRRGAVRRCGIAETLRFAKRNLPTRNMCPPGHVAKHGQQAAQWHPNRAGQYQATGAHSSLLARDAWCGFSRSGTSTDEARAVSCLVAPNVFRVSASQGESKLPVARARRMIYGWPRPRDPRGPPE